MGDTRAHGCSSPSNRSDVYHSPGRVDRKCPSVAAASVLAWAWEPRVRFPERAHRSYPRRVRDQTPGTPERGLWIKEEGGDELLFVCRSLCTHGHTSTTVWWVLWSPRVLFGAAAVHPTTSKRVSGLLSGFPTKSGAASISGLHSVV